MAPVSSAERLSQAFKSQFEWVSALLTDRDRHSDDEQKRALMFFVMHSCFVLVVFAHLITVIASWALAFVLQAVSLGFAVMYAAYVNKYSEKMSNALELERNVNSMMVAQIAIAVFALFHGLLMRTWVIPFMVMIELAYNVYVSRSRSLLIDATTVWKDLDQLRRDSITRVVMHIAMTLGGMLFFMGSIFLS